MMGTRRVTCDSGHCSRGRAGATHSMRASAQVTAPGAIISMIVAASTRPNRQNRSTCSRISVPLVGGCRFSLRCLYVGNCLWKADCAGGSLRHTTTRRGAPAVVSCIQQRPAPYVSGQIGLRHKASTTARGASGRNLYQGVVQTMALHVAHDMSYRSRTKKRSPTNDAQAPELTAQQQSWPLLPRAAALSLSRLSLNYTPDQPRQKPPPREGHGRED